MTWATRNRVKQYLLDSLWIGPVIGVLLGLLGALIEVKIHQHAELPAQWRYSPSTASTVLSAIIGAMAALTGFVVTVTVLVVQMVIGTFSARYMRLWYRDPVLKGTLALLVGTLAFSFSLLRRVETNFVPDIGVTVAGVLLAAGLVLFLLFFGRFVHRLRPVAVAAIAAQQVQRSLRADVALLGADDIFVAPAKGVDGQPALAIRSDRRGAVQAINFPEVAQWARKHGCLASIKHSIGDFVQVGDPLIEVYGEPGDAAKAERTLSGLVALGLERTVEQDPAFAMRIMVDVANKALSAAINDPTTAVQVLNYIEDSLGVIGSTDLPERSWRPGAAAVGMVIPHRRWEDFLALGVTEIREYGRSSIQVMRRMRAMLERLSDDVLPERRAQVHDELERLDATVAQSFKGSIDLDRARIADRQGIGGPGRSGPASVSPAKDGEVADGV